MKNIISSQFPALILSIVGSTFTFLLIALVSTYYIPSHIFVSSVSPSRSTAILLKPIARLGIPVRLAIPRIQVSAVIEPAGATTDSSMAASKGPFDAAWFDLGPRPGENGSAVIAGHYGWKDGMPAAFDGLHKVHMGDIIYIKDTTGTTTIFVVRKIRTYRDKQDASDVFASSDGIAHLNLITCEGAWNTATKSYPNRLVVFADKIYE